VDAYAASALYTVSSAVEIVGDRFPLRTPSGIAADDSITVRNYGSVPAHFVLFGGETMDGPR
jgi:hypothetical protein